MARPKRERKVDPNTGKEVRAPRVPLTDSDKAQIVAERIKLGRILGDDELPETVKGEAAKLLGLGSTQLLRRIQRAAR